MRPLRFALLALLFLAAAESLAAARCVPALLSVYDAPLFSCTVSNPPNMASFENVSFSVLSTIGSPTLISDTQIMVTPVSPNPDYFGVEFTPVSPATLSVGAGQEAVYLIAYTWDPSVRDIDLAMDPPPGTGTRSVEDDICIGGTFTSNTIGSCTTFPNTATVTVSGSGQQFNTVSFTPPTNGIVGVREIVTLDATSAGNTTTEIGYINTSGAIPEPGTLVGGLLALAITIAKLRAKRF